MTNPYETCPIFENESYLIRMIDESDAPDLLLVYSDEKAVPFFNSDNCGGDDFYMTRLEYVQGAIKAVCALVDNRQKGEAGDWNH